MPLKEASPDHVRSTQPASRSGYKIADKTPLRTAREPTAPDVMAARSAAYSGGATNNTPAVALTPDMATTANVPSPVTPRQAKSAASVMAGQPSPGVIKVKQRRQAVLLGFVVLMALPVAAFYLFGDALLNSASMLPVSAVNTAPPAVVSPPAVRSAALSVALVSPAPAITAASAPAVERRTPVPRPAQVADNTRRTSIVTPTTTSVVSQVTPTVVTGPAKTAPLLASAYAAYQTGKSDEAARLYREVLKSDPGQRDAWLGLAVIAHAGNQREPAMDAYKRVLRLEPQNPTALAGLSSLNGSSDEPRQESRLRELLARSPQEADLNHALGLVLSGEQRWSEAQPLFFKAHALAPQEPKFAYNLAVTLDHLRKPSLAIQYYDTALLLAKGQSTAFDEQSARNRVSVLKASAAENKSP
jgi:tetratricopeptide (TPR) repeat protein